MALVALAPQQQQQQQLQQRKAELALPLPLFLSPKLAVDRAASLAEAARQRPHCVRIAEVEEEGALHVLPDFELEEVAQLERRRCRVIGAPFAERLAREPSAIERVPRLPVFDLVFRPGAGGLLFSGLQPLDRARCTTLARWMGARIADEVGTDVAALVTTRVSLLPDSKYQAALERRVPAVRPSFLDAMWAAKAEVTMQPHVLLPLSGLGVCFGGIQGASFEGLQDRAVRAGAVVQTLDRAEVVIVKDVFAPVYLDAQRIGILAAPPAWLERCLEVGACLPVKGDLEVQNPRSLPLRGGPRPLASSAPAGSAPLAPLPPVPGAASAAVSGGGAGSVGASTALSVAAASSAAKEAQGEGPEPECCLALSDCVLCLLYLPPGDARDSAKAMAWSLGAFTTLSPLDRAITHVLFKVSPLDKSVVQVSIQPDEDRVSFLDISWLEACSEQRRRLREAQYPQQRVSFNPVLDAAYAVLSRGSAGLGGRAGTSASSSRSGRAKPGRTLSSAGSDSEHHPAAAAAAPAGPPALTQGEGIAPPAPAAPAPREARPPRILEPLASSGVFAGSVVALWGWPEEHVEASRALTDTLRANGAAVAVGAEPAEASLSARPSFCVVPAFGAPVPSAATLAAAAAAASPGASQAPAFVTVHWVHACVADGARHPPSSFPHFEPGLGPLPLQSMVGCSVRITALGASGDSHQKRRRLEELAEVLGAKVAKQSSRWAEITHIVCAMPEFLEPKLYEAAGRKGVFVVGFQWLCDCFRLNSRQPEARYAVAPNAAVPGAASAAGRSGGLASTQALDLATQQPGATPGASGGAGSGGVLSGHEILMSPSALGSDERLPRMAEELGARVRAWRSLSELETMLEASGLSLSMTGSCPSAASAPASVGASGRGGGAKGGDAGGGGGGGGAAAQAGTGKRQLTVVLLDPEEASTELAARLSAESRGLFVVPAWLSETFQQHRRLPLDAFRALPEDPEGGRGAAKRPRLGLGELGEAAYAWQPAALRSLEALAEDSRAKAMESKAQEKVKAGLRIAELRQGEPTPRLGG